MLTQPHRVGQVTIILNEVIKHEIDPHFGRGGENPNYIITHVPFTSCLVIPVVGKTPRGQVDCLKEIDPTLRQKVLNMDTDFLSNPYKPTHEKDRE